MKKPLVSVLICTYNAEKTIHRALQSVLDQTYDNLEVLILDNNSKDNTIKLLDEYKKKDNRINIFSLEKNLGAYGGLNYLLGKAKGEYMAIQDHDDVWHPTKIEKQINFLEKNKDYVGAGTGYLEYYCKSKIGFLCDVNPKGDSRVNHTSLVFRKNAKKYDTTNDYLSDILFMKKILCEDKKNLYILPGILTLHYCKENGENYSSQWFKINLKNLKRHFYVHGFSLYHLGLFFYVCISSIIPSKLKAKLDYYLIHSVKKAQPIADLRKDKNIDDMLLYLN